MKTEVELNGTLEIESTRVASKIQTVTIGHTDEWREVLPYGKWICKGGVQVLFNRSYEPIWRSDAFGVEPVGDYWVHEILDHIYFFNDGNSPLWKGMPARESFERCVEELRRFGVKVTISDRAPRWAQIIDIDFVPWSEGDSND